MLFVSRRVSKNRVQNIADDSVSYHISSCSHTNVCILELSQVRTPDCSPMHSYMLRQWKPQQNATALTNTVYADVISTYNLWLAFIY